MILTDLITLFNPFTIIVMHVPVKLRGETKGGEKNGLPETENHPKEDSDPVDCEIHRHERDA